MALFAGAALSMAVEGAQRIGAAWSFTILGSIVALAIWGASHDAARMVERDKIRALGRAAWIADCTKPVDECFAAWDDGFSLRRHYYEKVAPSGFEG